MPKTRQVFPLDTTKADAGYPPRTAAPDTYSFHATADNLAFAIECLRQHTLTIVELETEVKRLKTQVAQMRKGKTLP